MEKRIKFLFLIAMIFFLSTACSLEETENVESKGLEDGQYVVYYKNQDGTALSGSIYETQTETDELLIRELLEQLATQPEDISLVPVLSEQNIVEDINITKDILYLNFDSSYNQMEASSEILCRAALVKTLTQVNDISNIDIKVDNKPLTDQDGTAVGLLSNNNFIEGDSTSMITKHMMTLMLYYTNKEGKALVETNRQVLYDNTVSVEKMVLNELIAGPDEDDEDMYPTLPSSLNVLGVSVKDGVCYVNVDSSFVTDALDVAEYIPIYSIVNSLVELSGITKVQISVNGSSDLVFREKIPLTQIFEWNLDYVGGDKY